MGLREYQRKRDFGRSPEPRGRVGKAAGRRFVVQKHAARRLHYDFRLEADGVLKSWAVPKGPSLDPAEKRLAVQVEDHPIDYGGFEGVIPEGEYGGGTVLLWDRGRWQPEGDARAGLRRGRLDFRLEGEKLRGGWKLVRLRGREGDDDKTNWLLIKSRDEAARPLAAGDILEERPESVASGRDIDEIAAARDRVWSSRDGEMAPVADPPARRGAPRAARAAEPRSAAAGPRRVAGARRGRLPASPVAQLATLVTDPPAGDGWLHELKFDGYRILCRLERGRPRLLSRRGHDWTERFAAVARAAAELPARSALLDGEVVALEPDGRSSFQALQRAMSEGREGALVYYVFDLLHLDGQDLSALPLEARKAALADLVRGLPADHAVRFSDHVAGGGEAFYRRACRLGVEGIVSKRRDAPYRPGRGRDWLKTKCLQRQEFVVGGFTEPSGSRAGLGALLVGVYDDGALRYAGKVGTGFDARTLRELRHRLGELERETPPFADPPRGAAARGVHWLEPSVVAEVAFTEWTADGILRHPSFQGLREDKPPREVRRERPEPTPTATAPGRRRRAAAAPRRPAGTTVAGVALSNPDRVLYPEQGITKLDLARYYERVADRVLPHVARRPLTLVRCPQGHEKECFYQKHLNEATPEAVHTVEVREESGETAPYLWIDDLAGLVSLVQIGVLELHVWGARVDALDRPDRLIFDLDPDPAVPWPAVVEAARRVRARLAELGLESWVKTTGGKGLHVAVPIQRRQEWDVVKPFTRAVAESIVREAPDRYLLKASKAARRGKVFIDYLRNGRGATAVVAYSTRRRPGAPVSTPLRWDELERGVRSDQFTIANLPARLARLRRDPWEGFATARQSITRQALRRLGLA